MSVNEEELEYIIKSAEHTKDLTLNSSLWGRLDGKLELDRHKKRSARYKLLTIMSTAACIILLIGVFIHAASHQENPKEFVIEPLDEYHMSNGVYQYEDIDFLNKKRACQPC